MRSLFTAVLAGCALALLVLPVSAQPPGGGRGGMGSGRLLGNKSVQKELKLTDEQITKAKEIVDQVNAKHKEERDNLQNLEGEERMQKTMELNRTVADETVEALNGVLQPEQIKRLKQIRLQLSGAMAFADPKVQAELKLTDDQKDKMKTIMDDSRKEMREMFQGGGGDREEMRKKMMALQKDTVDKVKAILTDDQKKTWESMAGAPFEMKFEGRGGGA